MGSCPACGGLYVDWISCPVANLTPGPKGGVLRIPAVASPVDAYLLAEHYLACGQRVPSSWKGPRGGPRVVERALAVRAIPLGSLSVRPARLQERPC